LFAAERQVNPQHAGAAIQASNMIVQVWNAPAKNAQALKTTVSV
jgi:hypothetical protein